MAGTSEPTIEILPAAAPPAPALIIGRFHSFLSNPLTSLAIGSIDASTRVLRVVVLCQNLRCPVAGFRGVGGREAGGGRGSGRGGGSRGERGGGWEDGKL